MKEFVKIDRSTEVPTVIGYDLYYALRVDMPYDDWFAAMCSYGFTEGQDYWTYHYPRFTCHRCTLDMAKGICLINHNLQGRQYFLEAEKTSSLSPAQILLKQAQILVEQENEVSHYYTILGYARNVGLRLSAEEVRKYGILAINLSKDEGYKIEKFLDPRFGLVDMFHENILARIFRSIAEEYFV